MDFKTFESQFVPFCKTPGVESQKPSSYYRAIQYLAEYLGISDINNDNAKIILAKEDKVKDKSSSFYKALLRDLELKGRKSYLENGFVSAAFPFFRRFLLNNNEDVSKKSTEKSEGQQMSSFQSIFFGAPGTGKSFKVNAILGKNRKNCFSKSDHPKSNGYANDLCDVKNVGFDVWSIDNIEFLEKKLVSFESDNKVTNPRHSALRAYIDFFKKYREENRENRTTFHPDYDYAQFVGAYKPKKEGEKITYSFVPQVFAKAYAVAWKLYLQRDSRDSIGASPLQNDSGKDIQVYLVIEEINRGNCAQIFGDIFQLLDRDGEGFSQYSIDADCDFAEWLKTNDNGLKSVWPAYEEKVGDGKLKLPPNLNILATMNTSDQSLFPMDSAFKRRFDWEYVPINYEKAEADFIVGDASFNFKWLDFLKKVNADIYKVTQSEDKQMGEFFIKPKNKDYVTLDEFRSKVLFYLWDSVYKDELDSKLVFHFAYPEKGPDVTFQRLFNSDVVEILKKMLANLDNEYKDGVQILASSGANP